MIRAIAERIRQGHRTQPYPKVEPKMPDRFAGRPVLKTGAGAKDMRACVEACPLQAIALKEGKLELDLGRCVFCRDCEKACNQAAVEFTNDYKMAALNRQDLVATQDKAYALAKALKAETLRLFGRSLKLRQVSAGGCNACEADLNVLTTVGYDLGQFGIQFVASPRHADGLVVTGPVTRNMALALRKTWDATPAPKILIASGACAISGGIYREHPECLGGVTDLLVDLYVPGCPPHPMTFLDGVLRMLGRINTR